MIDMFVDFLPCSVYRDASMHGDCTNGGTSSRHNDLYLCRDYVTPEDVREYCEAKGCETELFVKTETRFICGRDYKNIVLVDDSEQKKQHLLGGMSGGNLLYSCDSRWKKITGCDYPLSIHDRYETQELYEALSH